MPTEPAGPHTGTATILFTDLVGSTAQRAQLGEEAAETLRRTHDQLLTDAVAASRGTVAKHVGDGIMATFPGAADAVAAAVAIQQAIDIATPRTSGGYPLEADDLARHAERLGLGEAGGDEVAGACRVGRHGAIEEHGGPHARAP